MNFLSGFISIVGPPNVGKSTLLNRIMGKKLAIVSPKSQTTRNRIMGIYHGDGYQMAFIDTPGIHKTSTPLHRSMVDSALATFNEVDMLLVMIEMGHTENHYNSRTLKNLEKVETPCYLVINKIDKFPREHILPVMEQYSNLHVFESIIPVSAMNGDGVDVLLEQLKTRLKPGPQFFPEDMTTDQTEYFLVSEIIREKIFYHTREDLPYSSAVTVDTIEEPEGKNIVSIYARIHVESDSQKGILIGRNGSMIKSIGTSARRELENLFGMKVFLDLVVRVEKNWSKDTKALRKLGY